MLVEPYQQKWVDQFAQIHAVLDRAVEDIKHQLEHVGSTAVPGMSAKPIIDIDIVFYQLPDFPLIKQRLEELGYVHCGDQGIEGREVFKRAPRETAHPVLDEITHHLYVCSHTNAELHRHLKARDHLRACAAAREEYINLKIEIAKAANQDRKLYAQLKQEKAKYFFDRILKT